MFGENHTSKTDLFEEVRDAVDVKNTGKVFKKATAFSKKPDSLHKLQFTSSITEFYIVFKSPGIKINPNGISK